MFSFLYEVIVLNLSKAFTCVGVYVYVFFFFFHFGMYYEESCLFCLLPHHTPTSPWSGERWQHWMKCQEHLKEVQFFIVAVFFFFASDLFSQGKYHRNPPLVPFVLYKIRVPWWRWRERMIFFSKFQGKNHTSQSDCKEIKPVNPKGNQSWIFTGRADVEAETPTLWPPDAKNWLIGKNPDAEKDWRQEEKGMTEDMMVEWHHWLNGYEFEQALGVGDGQGSLACCSLWGCKESDMTKQLNWTELNWREECHQNIWLWSWHYFGII